MHGSMSNNLSRAWPESYKKDIEEDVIRVKPRRVEINPDIYYVDNSYGYNGNNTERLEWQAPVYSCCWKCFNNSKKPSCFFG